VSQTERAIDVQLALGEPIHCDRLRIAQLFPLAYGAPDEAIRVRSVTDGKSFDLSISNAGDPIPPGTIERLFLPFARGAVKANQQGLGLGLYIAFEIARAHGGAIDVTSTPAETRFTFRMPLG